MEKPKIIHVLYAGLGGHGNVVFPLIESDFGLEHTNVLVFFGIEKVLESYLSQSKKLGIKAYTIQKKPRRYAKAFSEFKKIITKEQPNKNGHYRIIIHSSELIIPAVNYRKKHPATKVFYVEHENNATKGISLKLLSKYALRKANAVVCLSENYKVDLCNKYNCKVPIKIIENGINTEKFSPDSTKKHSPIILGMASRMILGKDHTTLLNAFKKVLIAYPKTELHIAGNGETLENVKKLAKTLQISDNVKFLGLLNEKEMVDFYKTISIYVLATRSETLSTAILQAMACGLPLITSDIKNNAVLIDHAKTGWLYKDASVEDLTDKLKQIIGNYENALLVGVAARKYIEDNYSNLQMAKKYKQLIQ